MTPRHKALLAKVPPEALPLLRAARDADGTRTARAARFRARFAKLGLRLEAGSGIEKAFIIYGPDYVIKVGSGTDREAECSKSGKRRCLALTALLDASIAVQERADTVLGDTGAFEQHCYREACKQLPPSWRRQWKRIQQVCEQLGISDTHAWNIGVFADGRLKAIDFSF